MGLSDVKEKVGGFFKSKTFIGIIIVLVVVAIAWFLYTKGYLDDIPGLNKPAAEQATTKEEPKIEESYIPLINQLMSKQAKNLQ